MSPAVEARANLDLGFASDAAGITRLSRRYARYPWSLTRPFWIDRAPSGMASLIPQSSSGLLLPGDRFRQSIALEAEAAAHLTSQGAQVIHGTPGGASCLSNWDLSLAQDSYLELVLDPVVLFPYSSLQQGFSVTLEAGAMLVLSDGLTWHPDAGSPAFGRFASALDLLDGDRRLRVRERGQQTPAQLQAIEAASGRMPCASGQLWLLFGSSCPSDIALPAVERPDVYAASSRLPDDAGILLRFLSYDPTAFAAYQRDLWRSIRQSLFGQVPTDRRKGG